MQIKSQKDFLSGLMFLVLGTGFALGSTTYNIGTGARMGPGYFPLMLGILLASMGLVIAAKSLSAKVKGGDLIGAIAWRPLCFIIGGNVLFGILLGGLPSIKLPAMGLIVGIYVLTLVVSLAGDGFKLRDVLLLATGLAIGSYLAFIVLLKLQFPVWPAFLAG